MMALKKMIVLACMASAFGAIAQTAPVDVPPKDPAAKKEWEKKHPRRDQVNDRIARQNAAIKKDVKAGTLTPEQAAGLHAQEKQVRAEEKQMASPNNGHITAEEQKALNKELNDLRKEIPKAAKPAQ